MCNFYIAIKDIQCKIAGSTFTTMVFNRIEDDINVYIDYIMKLNHVISNILESNKDCYPMQIDVVIIGKEHEIRDTLANALPSGSPNPLHNSSQPLI